MLADAGHGRGMSQFGAFNQAVAGSGTDQILQHYYPGAVTGRVGATTVRIRLGAYDNETLDVYSDTELQVGDRRVVKGEAAHLTPTPDGGAKVTITIGCDGHQVWSGTTDNPWAFPVADGPNRPAAEQLAVCDGSRYRGALGVALEGDQPRTVNAVDLEDYLRGVVPAEMEAGWADQGGAAALRAQAVAARSYVLAEHRYPYAQSCDSTDCQMYPGTDKEDDRSTAAVLATAGQVLTRDGRILRTEYSSAPGGGQPIDIRTLDVGPRPQDVVADPAPGASAPPGLAGLVPALPAGTLPGGGVPGLPAGTLPGGAPALPAGTLPGGGVPAPGPAPNGAPGPDTALKSLLPNLTGPNPGTGPATGPDAIANAAAAAAGALLDEFLNQAPDGQAGLPSAPGVPETAAPGVPGTAAPSVLGTSAPGVPETSVQGVAETSAPGVPETSVPGVPGTSTPHGLAGPPDQPPAADSHQDSLEPSNQPMATQEPSAGSPSGDGTAYVPPAVDTGSTTDGDIAPDMAEYDGDVTGP
ncbi:SpoIID/LytB domain-containing protein [Nocardia stercoris]|uniref:SpoIID/LytB domain-containing protein n=1 Tax=Nocardia stercoris TaxID=2483361 RepID=A0A3M2LA28_9NOCA|nr:SpoIID/LytB domain-containing protein [Nocardia stercoris]